MPAPLATETIDSAKAFASAKFCINAPLPQVRSITKYSSPAASFLERIEAVMSGIDSTVPQTSRMAYIFLSAGAKLPVWPIMAQPTSLTVRRNKSLFAAVL